MSLRQLIVVFSIFLASASGNPSFQLITSLTNFDARIMSSWSGGGGPRLKLPDDSSLWPFAGREFGGGDRSTIYGSRTFGSGYPYGVTSNQSISSRPFPYGVWPIYWGSNYTGSDEYGPSLDPFRPGGQLVTIPVSKTSSETYYLVGDRDSAILVMTSMVTWCHAIPAWPSLFDPTSLTSVRPENIIQYYRASSFALAYLGYNNTFALNNTSTEATESDPLPNDILNSTFRSCVDAAIADAIPILDQPRKKTPVGVTIGIVFGIFGIPCLIGLYMIGKCAMAIRSELWLHMRLKKQLKRNRIEQRKAGLKYEEYP